MSLPVTEESTREVREMREMCEVRVRGCVRGFRPGAWDKAFVTSYCTIVTVVDSIGGEQEVSDATKGPRRFQTLQGGRKG